MMKFINFRHWLSIIVVLFLCFFVQAEAKEQLSAQAAVSAQDVFMGEAFQFQIQISGSENPAKPNLSGLSDFNVKDLGGQQNSSRSVTIVNGRMSQVVQHGYIFNFQLTAQREGDLTIPSISIKTDRGSIRTQPISIHTKKPMETDKFKLRLNLSRTQCTVGEPVTLTVTWYLGQDVGNFEFGLPLLNDDHFDFEDPEINQQPGLRYYRIPIGDEEVIGEKGRGTLDGQTYATITFTKVLIPRKAGTVNIPSATVSCEALVGYKKSNRQNRYGSGFDDDFFSGFFSDNFFGRRKGVYNRVVVPSNKLSLEIRPLPEKGRPPNFSGHVGEYHIQAAATPTEVSVGDPITLSIELSGPDYLDHVDLPALQQQQDLARDFKIPKDIADGKVAGSKKVFTQTIRARNAKVSTIPPIELPYFDTRTGKYRVARSKPIPLKVRTARVITADDAEGHEVMSVAARELRAWTHGIAANYKGGDLLKDQRYGLSLWFRSPIWLCLLSMPPFAYIILLTCATIARKRKDDPLASRQRRAFAQFRQGLRSIDPGDHEQILEAIKGYLVAKLRLSYGAVTFRDVRGPLEIAGIGDADLKKLESLFKTCEAGRYSGGVVTADDDNILDVVMNVIKALERRLG